MVVHNGIIENFQEIKDKLQKDGVEFISQTDTEVLAHLLDKYYNGNPIETISKMMVRIRGSYALSLIHIFGPQGNCNFIHTIQSFRWSLYPYFYAMWGNWSCIVPFYLRIRVDQIR